MNDTGYNQGYYIGLFFRFLWLFAVYFLFQSIIFYMFGYNTFTYYILTIAISFFMNTSLPINNRYPFFRHIIIYLCLLFANSQFAPFILEKLSNFFDPSWIWNTIILVSLIMGVLGSIGRYGDGASKKLLENIGGISLAAFIILAFVLFWWKGGLMYLLLRMPLIYLEVAIANAILNFSGKRYVYETEVH